MHPFKQGNLDTLSGEIILLSAHYQKYIPGSFSLLMNGRGGVWNATTFSNLII